MQTIKGNYQKKVLIVVDRGAFGASGAENG